MFESANPKQPFLINNRVPIFPRDLRILLKLYQPLLGGLGSSLYLTLNEDYSETAMISDAQGLYSLQEQLDCSLQDLFAAIHKLEGVGLLQTRLLDNEIMGQVLVFSLNAVPSSSEFFATALLASLLKEKVGEAAFHDLSHSFARESQQDENQLNGLQTAQDVSASFMEVFRLPSQEAISPSEDVQQAAQENQVKRPTKAQINQAEHIDWEFMKQQFEIYQIAPSEIDQHQADIAGLMRTYGLSEQEFVDETLSCLHGSYQLNMPLIKQTIAENIHSVDTKARLKSENQDASDQVKQKFNSREQQILTMAKEKAPAQFLYQLKTAKHDYVDASEYKVLDNLYNKQNVQTELLNILAYACLQESSTVSYRLANTILHDWLQHGVKTGAQALEYMANRAKKKAQRQPRSRYGANKRVEKGTDWSKKQAAVNQDISSKDLKDFFKNLEDKNGMK
ncbi:DnaD domain protein [Lactobacillus sp. ESL0681]|uniref:DnaD domain protein n=1 Tax=Lactobacillus sp. ESL0681 TaxID=2983211 RepID=UPI0023F8136E|nr:DnaD domain protein [Lactobacillus sp. ESL0681]WEV40942.1 DnaD domain protein [Lactobacillus sp. ESL0681]